MSIGANILPASNGEALDSSGDIGLAGIMESIRTTARYDRQPIKLMQATSLISLKRIRAGCDICTVGHDKYLIGDADLPGEDFDTVAAKLERINEKYATGIFRSLKSSRICAHPEGILMIRRWNTGQKTQSPVSA
ncbi:hypothetical protein [Phyllobacterium sp. SB3]|uniref:hypothetical protein n=1 Tax=Phyllobacterium sp. SB3 TaxID=3156073 RepID=UPI0032AEFB27